MEDKKTGLKCPPPLLSMEPVGITFELRKSINSRAIEQIQSEGADIEKITRSLNII